MSGLKEVRNRIESVKSTKQITSAMKMVAAAKFRKAQQSIVSLRPYALKMKELLQHLSQTVEETSESPFSEERDVEKVLLVVITGNKGLCGAFNSNVIKKTCNVIDENYKSLERRKNVDIICFGKKGNEWFQRNDYNLIESYIEVMNSVSFDKVSEIAENIMKSFTEGEYDKVELVYNKFRNAASQDLVNEQYLPVLPDTDHFDDVEVESKYNIIPDYIFQPSKLDILTDMVPKSLKIVLFRAILESLTAEHGARMTAMHMATDNASDLLKELKLSYNKARQAAITKEILEIVSGAEALKG